MMDAITQFMLSTGIDNFVATQDWVWPVCEILHFFGMALLIGSVGLVDLRMLGIAKGVPIKALERFIPLGVIGFVVNATTGFIFVAGNPVGGPQEYLTNLAFQIKMMLIADRGSQPARVLRHGHRASGGCDHARRRRADEREGRRGLVAARCGSA